MIDRLAVLAGVYWVDRAVGELDPVDCADRSARLDLTDTGLAAALAVAAAGPAAADPVLGLSADRGVGRRPGRGAEAAVAALAPVVRVQGAVGIDDVVDGAGGRAVRVEPGRPFRR